MHLIHSPNPGYCCCYCCCSYCGVDKHLIQYPLPRSNMPTTLILGGVRNVYDWVMAMRRVCYCCEKMRDLPDFRSFLTNNFSSYGTCKMKDLVFDEGSRPFRNILEARQLKLQNLLDLRNSRR